MRTELDLDDNEPRMVSGVRGAQSRPFTKKFKNADAMSAWMDSDAAGDYEVQSVERVR